MKEVKYIAYACLIAIASAGTFSFLSLLTGNDAPERPAATATNTAGDTSGAATAANTNSKGFALFRENCGTCHAVDKVLSGPALAGVMSRGPWAESEENMVSWIKNPAAFIPTTTYTQELQKQYGQIMPSFSKLKDDEIKEIVEYLKGL